MTDMNVDMGGGRQRTVNVEYPANSQKGKPEPKPEKIEPVVTGTVTKRKKGLFNRAANSIVEDTGEGVMEYIVTEVLIPAAKNMIADAFSQGIERLLFGGTRSSRSSGTRPGYTSYNKVHNRTSYTRPELTRQQRARHDFDDIILDNRPEAEDVLDQLRELVDKYEVATVADLYQMVGLTEDFTDQKWGWYDLKHAGIRVIRGGYILSLPRPQPIE